MMKKMKLKGVTLANLQGNIIPGLKKTNNPNPTNKPDLNMGLILSRLNLPDISHWKDFNFMDWISNFNPISGLVLPEWITGDVRQIFEDPAGWWAEKKSNMESFFDTDNPEGAIKLIRKLIPTEAITTGVENVGKWVKGTAQDQWERLKDAAKKHPGITGLSMGTFMLPIIAPFFA